MEPRSQVNRDAQYAVSFPWALDYFFSNIPTPYNLS